MEDRRIRQAAEVIESGFVADDGVGRAAADKKKRRQALTLVWRDDLGQSRLVKIAVDHKAALAAAGEKRRQAERERRLAVSRSRRDDPDDPSGRPRNLTVERDLNAFQDFANHPDAAALG